MNHENIKGPEDEIQKTPEGNIEFPEEVKQCIVQEKSKLVEEINRCDSVKKEYDRFKTGGKGYREGGRVNAGLTSFMFGIPILSAALMTGGKNLSIEAGVAAVLTPHIIEGVRELAHYGKYKYAEHKRKKTVKTLLGGTNAESVVA